MSRLRFSHHAARRFAQRGFRAEDADLIMELGTEVEDGFMVTSKDIHVIEQSLKAFIRRLHRLEGARIVVAGNKVITGYDTPRQKQRKLLRGT